VLHFGATFLRVVLKPYFKTNGYEPKSRILASPPNDPKTQYRRGFQTDGLSKKGMVLHYGVTSRNARSISAIFLASHPKLPALKYTPLY